MGIRYNPALDGLRALAVLAVVAFHVNILGFDGGFVGVDVFFVLSGYLITSLLLAERDRTGTIDIRGFYWRRAKRLYPALLLMLVAYLAVAPILWPREPNVLDALMAGLYLTDYSAAFTGGPSIIQHTWSLSVEEHFYLLWPPILLLALNRYTLTKVRKGLLIAAVISYVWCVVNQEALGLNSYYRFDTHCAGLIAGCWLATKPPWIAKLPEKLTARVSIWLLALVVLVTERSQWDFDVLSAIPVATACAVGVLHGVSTLPLTSRPLVWLGRLSYGIYLWHIPIMLALKLYAVHGYLLLCATLALSAAASAVSYFTVEAPFRSKRNVFQVAAGKDRSVGGVAGVLRPIE